MSKLMGSENIYNFMLKHFVCTEITICIIICRPAINAITYIHLNIYHPGFLIFQLKYVVGTHWKHLTETLPKNTTTNIFIG